MTNAAERGRSQGASMLRGIAVSMTLGALAFSAAARAQIDDRLATCARIAASSERLACYDALSAARKNATRDWNHAFGPDTAHSAPVTAEPAGLAPAAAADFGFDKGRQSGDVEQIQSRYDGEFTGWSGNTLFRLENGQVWKQAQSGRVAQRVSRPMVTIERTTLGGYRMNVEGLSESIRVERVK